MSNVGMISQKELQYFTGAGTQTLRALERAGLLRMYPREILRQANIVPYEGDVEFPLNPAQQEVFQTLLERMEQRKPGAALLYGVAAAWPGAEQPCCWCRRLP